MVDFVDIGAGLLALLNNLLLSLQQLTALEGTFRVIHLKITWNGHLLHKLYKFNNLGGIKIFNDLYLSKINTLVKSLIQVIKFPHKDRGCRREVQHILMDVLDTK